MKKLLPILFLFITVTAYSAPPSRTYTYTTGSEILASEVTANEDNIYNYLQAGVDTYVDLSIVNADINGAANIQSDKLNLTAIGQAVGITSSGSLTNAGTLSQTGSSSFGAISDLGTVATGIITAIKINGGNIRSASIKSSYIADTNIGGATATGELLVNNASDYTVGLGSQGTSGQVLTSAGAGANPTFSDVQAYVAGDTYLIYSLDTERTTASAVYVKSKSIVLARGGELRIKFDLAGSGAGTDVHGRIYRNGVAVGTEQTDADGAYTTYSEDISGWTLGDTCEVYINQAGAVTAKVKNFRIYATVPTVEATVTDTSP